MTIRAGYVLVVCSVLATASAVVNSAPAARTPAQGATNDMPAAGAATMLAAQPADPVLQEKAFVRQYCVTCHNQRAKTAGLLLDTMDLDHVGADAAAWEKVVTKLRAGLMPPPGLPRPAQPVVDGFISSLTGALDRAADADPNPGRTEALHRLNRAEYQNAIRDLLSVNIDASPLLPTDEVSYGFDNIAGVLKLSPLLTERYLNAAQKVARLALGTPAPPGGELYRVPDQLDQDVRLDGMPIGTRGGLRVDYFAPRDGEYDIKVRLGRGIDLDVPHFIGEQDLEISVDGERVQMFVLADTPDERLNIEREVFPTPGADGPAPPVKVDANGDPIPDEAALARRTVDDNWVVRVPLGAGDHEIIATFLMKTDAVSEGFRKPFLKPYIGRGPNDSRETREGAALRDLEIMGPFEPGGAQESPSRQRVFVCHPATSAAETGCAKTILATLARRAYRRPVTDAEVGTLLDFYNKGSLDGGFDAGIELALERLLVSPSFLFRAEFEPVASSSSTSYHISDVELASRLSFFLWSSIPDDELLDVAAKNQLHDPAVLERETRRMLSDPKSEAFTTNFAGQWLSLRRLRDIVPDPYLFPDYGDSRALAFEKESELFFDSVVRENRPAAELLTANYTFVNERLAEHYGIPNVKGVNFQRVELADDSPRRGLLGKGAILTVTSLPNRTSPVVRGKWVLQALLGTPPPDPPPNVPALAENGNQVSSTRTMRERLEAHRSNAVCASCHKLMDPIGFALENFDAVGKYRKFDENYEPIDNSGVYADGTKIDGLSDLRQVLVNHSDQFLVHLTDTLMTYALGRGVEYYDAPAVRKILRDAAPDGDRLSALIVGIVKSVPFQLRRIDS